MKNFPHQASSLDKLLQTARVAVDLYQEGVALTNAAYGDALARAGVYSFREGGDIEAALAAEQLKPLANQGSRTAARDFRRTLRLLGIIDLADAPTPVGAAVLAAETDELRNALWRSALLGMSLGDAGQVSHPYRILLRLVADNPGIEVRRLLLALEARDDSEAEYDRILALADAAWDEVLADLNLSEASAANAIKILPSLAFQLGDLIRTPEALVYSGAEYQPKDVDDLCPPQSVSRTTTTKRGALGEALTPEQVAPTPNFQPTAAIVADLTAGVEIRKRRTEEHQALVRAFAAAFSVQGFALYAGMFDCLAISGQRAILVEAKTLDGSPADERSQAEKAIGQLAGYLYFDIPVEVDAANVERLLLFSRRPSDPTNQFLGQIGIRSVWPSGDQWRTRGPDGHDMLYGF